MPLNDKSLLNFYQGNCAEMHVASLFYFAGYEASKISPDAGIDFAVTNIARTRFLNETPKTAHVQVKSTWLDKTGATIYLEKDELEFLCSGDDRFTVFVLFNNLTLEFDCESFNIYANQVDKLIDQDMNRCTERRIADEGRRRKAQGLDNLFDFSHADLMLFWLNSNQMKKIKDERLWKPHRKKEGFFLNIKVDEYSVHIGDLSLVPELSEVRYIMRDCGSSSDFKAGKYSMHHL